MSCFAVAHKFQLKVSMCNGDFNNIQDVSIKKFLMHTIEKYLYWLNKSISQRDNAWRPLNSVMLLGKEFHRLTVYNIEMITVQQQICKLGCSIQ